MRVKLVQFAAVLFVAGVLTAPRASAQNPDTMMPEQNEAKAKRVLQDLINGLGGSGYTEVRESQCQGRRAQFGHSGDLTGYVDFTEYRRYPDKDRTEFIAKGHNTLLAALIGVDDLDITHGGVVIAVYNGDQGWTLDRSGISELPITSVSDFQEQVKRNIDNLLRLRLHEDGLSIRYGGTDTVDLKEVDWVEITDKDQRTFRLAVDRSSHFLVRSIVTTQDEENQQLNQDVTIYTNYQLKDSVWTPLQVSREHNGRRTSQIFFNSCKFNPGLPDDFFTKTGLQKKGAQLGIKKSKNEKN